MGCGCNERAPTDSGESAVVSGAGKGSDGFLPAGCAPDLILVSPVA